LYFLSNIWGISASVMLTRALQMEAQMLSKHVRKSLYHSFAFAIHCHRVGW
jgi:uncharacterized phage-associated protein